MPGFKKLPQTNTPISRAIPRRVHRLLEAIRSLRRKLALEEHANVQLRNSHAQFRALVESSVDHIFMLDERGVYLFSNDQVAAFGMRSGKQLVGRRLQDVYPHEICTVYREKLKEVISSGCTVLFSHEKESNRGTEFYQNTLCPIHREGRVWAVGGICRDLSESKRIEKQLSQAQKMEALGTLVAGVAHEINNPVNLILFNLPLFEKMWRDLMPMLDAIGDGLQHSKFGGLTYPFIKQNMPRLISDMKMAADRVAHIVNGLKQFSRKSNPAEKSDIQVNVAVENAAHLAASTLSNSRTELQLDLVPNLPLLHANLQNLEQIVLNLIINAHQSIDHNKGLIWIKTGWRSREQAIFIEVTDNGRGINPSVAEKIFDPFVTDRQAQGGTGIGLSVSYNLVKAHNGEISFESSLGKGTKFMVVLPAAKKPKPQRVMVVDDDAAFRALLIQTISRKTNLVVEGFSNGAEALIRLGSYPPDLLVLDMFMPEIDGLGVCRAIKNELGLKMMKVIIVTGFPKHPNITAAEQLGFHQILTKPLDLERFIQLVKESLDGKPSS